MKAHEAIDKHLRVALTHVEEALDELEGIEGTEVNGGKWTKRNIESMSFELRSAKQTLTYARDKLTRVGKEKTT